MQVAATPSQPGVHDMSKTNIVIELSDEQLGICAKYAASHGLEVGTVISAMKNLLWRKEYNRSPRQKAMRKEYNARMGSLRQMLNRVM